MSIISLQRLHNHEINPVQESQAESIRFETSMPTLYILYQKIYSFSDFNPPSSLSYITSMFSSSSSDLMVKLRTNSPNKSNKNSCKYVVISTIFIFVIYMFLSSHPYIQPQARSRRDDSNGAISPTNVSHLVFGIGGTSRTWRDKRRYIEAWWKPNITRGFVFLDRAPTEHMPWPSTDPPFRVSEDNSRYRNYDRHRMPFTIRMVRVIEETFKEEKGGEARWYVMTDDDTVFFMENLVGVLSKYDHRKYYYIGMNSECLVCNVLYAFDMGFGGAGFALSYPLAKALALNMDSCIKRYPFTKGSDYILQSCIADLGVAFTRENGFHQLDFQKDVSGFLSAHPHSPLVSLHHLDSVDPIFPSTNRTESLNLLMKAASIDESRLLQQSVCYFQKYNWTISAAWGYSVQIYESFLPPSHLYRPLETFGEWLRGASPPYMFNARPLHTNSTSCDLPHVFFFFAEGGGDATAYVRRSARGLPPCGAHSADSVARIRLISPSKKLDWKQDGGRRECCDVAEAEEEMDSLVVKLRECGRHEMLV